MNADDAVIFASEALIVEQNSPLIFFRTELISTVTIAIALTTKENRAAQILDEAHRCTTR